MRTPESGRRLSLALRAQRFGSRALGRAREPRRQCGRACRWGDSTRGMLALRSFFGYRKIRCLFGIRSSDTERQTQPRTSAMPLTKRQREILNYLATYTEQNGYAPSFEEIAETFEYSSLATVHEHLTNLERKGYIKRSYNESRAIEILPSDATPRALELPILGSVAAGL